MPNEVAANVYQQQLAHSKVVYLDDSNLLIDSGPDSEWENLTEFIDNRGGVDLLFLSHAHSDHVSNAKQVIDKYNPEVLIPENEPFDDIDLSQATVTEVTDREEIVNGVEVIEVPGHTEGICALYLSRKEVLLCTDVLDGADRRGLPSGFILPPPAMYNWNSEAAEKNLEKFLDLSFEIAIVSHGTNVMNDPRLKLEKYLDFLNHYRQDLLEDLG